MCVVPVGVSVRVSMVDGGVVMQHGVRVVSVVHGGVMVEVVHGRVQRLGVMRRLGCGRRLGVMRRLGCGRRLSRMVRDDMRQRSLFRLVEHEQMRRLRGLVLDVLASAAYLSDLEATVSAYPGRDSHGASAKVAEQPEGATGDADTDEDRD